MCNTDKFKDHRHNYCNCGRIQNVNNDLVCDKFIECSQSDFWFPMEEEVNCSTCIYRLNCDNQYTDTICSQYVEEGDIDGID